MKKILNSIGNGSKNFFSKIGSFIDKRIITPITKSILFIGRLFTGNKKVFEKVLTQKNSLIFLSLLLALTMFFVIDQRANLFIESSAEVLYNQPVKAIYNEEAYVIEGLPETVDVTLIGRKADLYLAKQLPVQEVVVDLSNLKPGTHRIDIRYRQPITSIDYKVDPSFTTVVIYPKVSRVRTLSVDILNQDKLDPTLFIDGIELSKDEIIIKEAEHNLNKVATVKALIDINNFPHYNIGELELTDIPLIAYDKKGERVDVEIVPSRVNATISISSPYKEVPIKVIPVGEVAFGKAIDTMSVDVSTITVYGDQETLENINYIPVEIDVSGISENRQYNVSLDKPSGIRHLSESHVNVSVTLDEEINEEFSNIRIEHRNLGSGFNIQAMSAEDTAITVIVKGTDQVIEEIDENTIYAYVDLSGYTVGEHEVEVIVYGDDLRATYLPKVRRVNIRITRQ